MASDWIGLLGGVAWFVVGILFGIYTIRLLRAERREAARRDAQMSALDAKLGVPPANDRRLQ